MLSMSGLNTGFFISRKNIFIISQRFTFPYAVIKVQNATSFLLKFRVAREYPTMMLPWFNSIFLKPSPDSCTANLSNNSSVNGFSRDIVTAKSRQWNSIFRWQFTSKGFYLNDNIRGKNRVAARIVVCHQVLQGVLQKIFSSTCLRFAVVGSAVLLWFCYLYLLMPLKQFLLERRYSKVTCTGLIFASTLYVRSRRERLGMDFFSAYLTPIGRNIVCRNISK